LAVAQVDIDQSQIRFARRERQSGLEIGRDADATIAKVFKRRFEVGGDKIFVFDNEDAGPGHAWTTVKRQSRSRAVMTRARFVEYATC
jgi:hypothetical protein